VCCIQEALEAVTKGEFQILISDIGLPDGSGIDLMREIRRHHSIPGIVLSGYGTEEDQRRSRDAGFSAHLIKPVRIDKLRSVLSQIPLSGHP
ncbi:MAG: response regulator, partial [Verrucomicrobiaceae bacterium]